MFKMNSFRLKHPPGSEGWVLNVQLSEGEVAGEGDCVCVVWQLFTGLSSTVYKYEVYLSSSVSGPSFLISWLP